MSILNFTFPIISIYQTLRFLASLIALQNYPEFHFIAPLHARTAAASGARSYFFQFFEFFKIQKKNNVNFIGVRVVCCVG